MPSAVLAIAVAAAVALGPPPAFRYKHPGQPGRFA